jgi:hypothetical protein
MILIGVASPKEPGASCPKLLDGFGIDVYGKGLQSSMGYVAVILADNDTLRLIYTSDFRGRLLQ